MKRLRAFKHGDYVFFRTASTKTYTHLILGRADYTVSNGEVYRAVFLCTKQPNMLTHYYETQPQQIYRCYPTFVGFRE